MRPPIFFVASVFALAGGQAQAQFQCTAANGTVTFQQTPCPSDARKAERISIQAPTPGERPEHIRRAIAEKRIVAGMTLDEVRRAVGRQPDAKTTSIGPGAMEQLVYRLGADTLYVYLQNGTVVSASRYDDDRPLERTPYEPRKTSAEKR